MALKKEVKKCPENYGSDDQMTKDCDDCGEAKLYRRCQNGNDHLACAGYTNNKGPNCCKCYEKDPE